MDNSFEQMWHQQSDTIHNDSEFDEFFRDARISLHGVIGHALIWVHRDGRTIAANSIEVRKCAPGVPAMAGFVREAAFSDDADIYIR